MDAEVHRHSEAFDRKFASAAGDATSAGAAVDEQKLHCSRHKTDDGHPCGAHPSGPLQASDSSPSVLSGMLPVPSRSYQFEADFKRLENHPEQFYSYFKVM